MKYCVKCGNKLIVGTKFCTKCGSKIITISNEANNSVKIKRYYIYEIFMAVITILFALTAAANTPGGYTSYTNVTAAFINKTILYLLPCSIIIFIPALLVGKYVLSKKTALRYISAILISFVIVVVGIFYLAYGVLGTTY